MGVVTQRSLVKILAMPAFYMKCPEYFFMRDLGLPVASWWLDNQQYRLAPFRINVPLGTFANHTRAMQEAFQDRGPASVVRFLEKQLGYHPDGFVVYYGVGLQGAQELLFRVEQGGSNADDSRDYAEPVCTVP